LLLCEGRKKERKKDEKEKKGVREARPRLLNQSARKRKRNLDYFTVPTRTLHRISELHLVFLPEAYKVINE